MSAMNTYGIELRWGTDVASATKVVDIKDFPDLMQEPETLDCTTLSDAQKTAIPGIRGSSLMAFNCNYTSADFAKVEADANKELYYVLAFPDGSQFSWKGEHTCGVTGKGVNEVVEFQINVCAVTAVEFTAATV